MHLNLRRWRHRRLSTQNRWRRGSFVWRHWCRQRTNWCRCASWRHERLDGVQLWDGNQARVTKQHPPPSEVQGFVQRIWGFVFKFLCQSLDALKSATECRVQAEFSTELPMRGRRAEVVESEVGRGDLERSRSAAAHSLHVLDMRLMSCDTKKCERITWSKRAIYALCLQTSSAGNNKQLKLLGLILCNLTLYVHREQKIPL